VRKLKTEKIIMSNKTSQIIRNQRKQLNLSQEQMAHKMGVTVNYISLIENKRKNPGAVFINNFAKKFNIPTILLTQDNLIPKPKNNEEKEILTRLESLMGDLEKLFLKSAD